MPGEDFYDDDLMRDEMYEAIGQEYASENSDDIVQRRQISVVAAAAISAHIDIIDAVEREMKKAFDRLAEQAWDEAVFHSARAIDSYVTEVFVKPFYRLALAPFKDAFPHVSISDDAIFSEVNALESGMKFVCIGIAATCEKRKATALIGRIRAFVKKPKLNNTITWSIRNTVLHSVSEPLSTEASQFVSLVETLLRDLSETLRTRAEETRLLEQDIENRLADSRAYKN